jgi:predicted component of type VI protein secretion system
LSFAPFMLGLGGLPALPPDEVRAALARRIAHLAAREGRMASRREAQSPLPDHVAALFDFSLTLAAAERRWMEAALARLEEREDD